MARWWDKIMAALTGKNVAILGPRAAGKTALYDYLEHSSLDTGRERTQTIGQKPRKHVRRKDLGLTLRKGADISGSDVYYPQWQALWYKADVVFYVFNAHQARTDPEYVSRISQDGKKLKEWGVGSRKIYILATHRDMDPLSSSMTAAHYADAILELDVVEALSSRLQARSVSVGDLASKRSAKVLVKEALRS